MTKTISKPEAYEHQGEPDYELNRELREWLGEDLRDHEKLEAPDFCCNGAWAHELELAMVRRGWTYRHWVTQLGHFCTWFKGWACAETCNQEPLRGRRDAAHAAMVAEREAQAKEKQEST
jgi:hypothetical protein